MIITGENGLSNSVTNPIYTSNAAGANGVISVVNSSVVTLGSGAVFTGTAEDITNYGDVRVSVFADVASATNGLQIQQSQDGTNWDASDAYTVPAATNKVYGVAACARYFRVVYTNGGTIQAAFRLQVCYKANHNKSSSVKPQDGRSNENDFEENLAHLMGFNGTSWDRWRDFRQFKTYSAAANITVAASATDIATITGNATTVVYITKVIISGVQTTGGLVDVQLIKRSAVDTGGTSGAITAIPHDSTDAAASATLLAYTANPGALGAAVGTIRRTHVPVDAPASVVGKVAIIFEFADKGRPLTLRGVAEQLAVNLNGVTVTGGVFDIGFEWVEA